MLKKILWILFGGFLLIQFFRPNFQNPPIDPSLDFEKTNNPPPAVLSILKSACYDCHSNETVYPWYAQIAPVSWWLANHINEGRENLNFSEFGRLAMEDQQEILGEAAEVVQEGEMPLPSYTWTHPKATLSPDEKSTLVQWLQTNGGEAPGKTETKDDD
jgi:hypothetical protein